MRVCGAALPRRQVSPSPPLGADPRFAARAEHPNISYRPQQSVPEEFSAPLELSQPLSGLMDGSISHPSPTPSSPLAPP